jgi:hypothetical protein
MTTLDGAMNSKKNFILFMGLALASLFPSAGFAQSRTVEMVQPMPIGFRITNNLGFRQKDRFLYYWFRNSARYTDETLMQYDTRSRTKKKSLVPLERLSIKITPS